MKRFRIKYSKKEALKYTSGLEIQKIWERSLRRGHLPVAYSQGFHPQAHLNQAAPLPLGFTSSSEWIDIWFEDEASQELLFQVLPGVVPPGIEIQTILEIDLSLPTMQNNFISAAYRVVILNQYDRTDLVNRINRVWDAPSLPRIRRQKEYDLRILLEEIHLEETDSEWPAISMKLAARPGATGRPEEVLLEMDIDPMLARIEKTDSFFTEGFIS